AARPRPGGEGGARAPLTPGVGALGRPDGPRTGRPAVTDEVRTGLYFVGEVFWDAIPRIEAELAAALRRHYPEVLAPPAWLGLATWIGGDRVGKPSCHAALPAEMWAVIHGLAT